jgi:hypothetical protein
MPKMWRAIPRTPVLALAALLALVPGGVMAAIAPPTPQVNETGNPPADESPPVETNLLDIWHARISSTFANSIDRIDRFFGDERVDEEEHRSRFHTRAGLRLDGKGDESLLSDLSLRLALPRLENRWHLFLNEFLSPDETEHLDVMRDTVEDREPRFGLRHILTRSEMKWLNADLGLRLGPPTQAFGRLRGRLTFPVHDWQLQLMQTVSLFSEDGWDSRSEMRWNRLLQDDYLFRSSSRLAWNERSPGVAPSQTLSLHKKLNERSAWRLAVSGVWPEAPHTTSAKYSTALTYRRLMYRRWLFLEVTSGLEFPQADGYEPNPFIIIRCEVIFSER